VGRATWTCMLGDIVREHWDGARGRQGCRQEWLWEREHQCKVMLPKRQVGMGEGHESFTILCTSAVCIAALGLPLLSTLPCHYCCCATTRSSLDHAGPPRLSVSAVFASVRPTSTSLPLVSCVLTGVSHLGGRPRCLPFFGQRLCPRPLVKL
jgi:hypothetical protein